MIRTALCCAAYSALLPMLASCGIIPIDIHRPPPTDFPKLVVAIHVVSQQTMLGRCVTPIARAPLACAAVDFNTMTCNIWYSVDVPPTKEIDEHERLHCKGYDHIGESTIRDLWQKYKQKQTR